MSSVPEPFNDPSLELGTSFPGDCPNCVRAVALRYDSRAIVWPSEEYRQDWRRHTRVGGSSNLPYRGVPAEHVLEAVFSCMHCGQTTVVHHHFAEGDDSDRAPWSSRIVAPRRAPRELPPEAPDEVRNLYREASECEYVGAYRGAAGLLRATVDLMTKDQGFRDGNLVARIDALAGAGVEADVLTDLHEARFLGNESLHGGTVFAPEEVADVAELIEDAAYSIYVEPARKAEMREARAARRRRRPGSD